MARFHCRACGEEGTFVYDAHRDCPGCGATDVQIKVLLWIVSDLHLESTRGWDLPSKDARLRFDFMIVAGDLIPRMERGVRWLFERVPDRPVIYVAGNHEGYGCDIDRTVEKARQTAAGTRVIILQNDAVRIGDVTFIGATLWTDFDLFGDPRRAMRVAGDRMNDYKKIRVSRYAARFRPQHALARHLQSRAFFEAEMRKPRDGNKLVAISHHAPHPGRSFGQMSSRIPLSDEEILTAAYRSNLTSLMLPSPNARSPNTLHPADLWIYGHTHEFEDVTIGHTRVVSNAKGYGPWKHGETWDNVGFNPNFIVEI
jgi:predicted phosphodiesterase